MTALSMRGRRFRPSIRSLTRQVLSAHVAALDELGLEVTGQRLDLDRDTVLACRVVEPDSWCHRCCCQGLTRDTVVRRRRTSPSAGGPRRWWSRSGATSAPAAGTSGVKTPPALPSHARDF